MGSVFKKSGQTPLPKSATVEGGTATWTGRDGKIRTAPVKQGPAGPVVIVEAPQWYMQYRDAAGRRVLKSTGCRDKRAAQAMLARAERDVERERAGLLTHGERVAGKATGGPVAEIVDLYCASLAAAGRGAFYVAEQRRRIITACAGCGFASLRDFDPDTLGDWLAAQVAGGMARRTRNTYYASLRALCRWAVRNRMLEANPIESVQALNENIGRVRNRRAMTDAELAKLLVAAHERPIADAERAHKGKGKAKLRPHTQGKLELLGRNRALAYRAMVALALRAGEAAALRVRHLNLEGTPPTVTIPAEIEKAGRGAVLPIPPTVAGEWRAVLVCNLEALQRLKKARRQPVPESLPGDYPALVVPSLQSFYADLAHAEIPRKTDAGQLDRHALRHTGISRWAVAGVPLVQAQKMARHSTPVLTAKAYIHLDAAALAESLSKVPDLPK